MLGRFAGLFALAVVFASASVAGCSASDGTIAIDAERDAAPGSAQSDGGPSSTTTKGDGGPSIETKSDGGPRNDDGGPQSTTALDPPAGDSSHGSGGAAPVAGATRTASGVTYRLIVPPSYSGAKTPLLVVFSGTEGGSTMTQNLISLGPLTGTDGTIRVVLDGVDYNGDGAAGAKALDDVRANYNIDNDRTYLLGESAGTTAALELGFGLRQSYFAAYWANDVTAWAKPVKNAAALGFAPFGQAGPGGDYSDAKAIVDAMKVAGYRVPTPAPYAGAGASSHGSPDQFISALKWLAGKSR